MASTSRPLGISILCFGLGWLSFGGFANAAVIALNEMSPIPKWFSLFALAYGVTAFMATLKLWRMDQSAVIWTRSWATVVILMSFAMIPIFSDLALGGIGAMLGFVLMTAVLLWLMDRFVSKKLAIAD